MTSIDQKIADHTSKILRLCDITNLIKSTLLNLSNQNFWVKAHLHVNRAGLKGGHFYCDLFDVDDHGNQIAKNKGTIWSARRSSNCLQRAAIC